MIKEITYRRGSEGSAACGGRSDLSEWPRSTDEEGFSKPTKMSGTATGRQSKKFIYAGMVELVDSVDLGSTASACRFESCCPHQAPIVFGQWGLYFAANKLYNDAYYGQKVWLWKSASIYIPNGPIQK